MIKFVLGIMFGVPMGFVLCKTIQIIVSFRQEKKKKEGWRSDWDILLPPREMNNHEDINPQVKFGD